MAKKKTKKVEWDNSKFMIENLAALCGPDDGDHDGISFAKRIEGYKKTPLTKGNRDEDFSKRIEELKGAKIVAIGFANALEGGFSIDYKKPKWKSTRRIILGYTELGEWVEWQGDYLGN